MAARRRENAQLLAELLQPLAGRIDPLWGSPGPGEIPQTFPVRIAGVSRDKLYFAMNAAGFGVVSLYYRLVSEIAASTYPISHSLSREVMNLPVHPEATQADIEEMVRCLPMAMDEVARAPGNRKT